MLSRRTHSITILLALIPALLLAACKPGGCEPAGEEGVRRIVLISIDTLRADHLGTYGHRRKTSPNLDALAARGAVFEDTSTTAPWTLPAHVSMLTGLYPEQTRVRTREVLGEDIPTMAETLLAAGYRTGGMGNVRWLQPAFRLNRGFEQWRLLPADESRKGAAARITDFGMEFLEQNDGERCFLFLHYFDVHSPYRSQPVFERAFLPPGFRKTSKVTGATMQLGLAATDHGYVVFSEQEREDLERLYDAGILQLDYDLGRLFRFIDERFGFDDTLVIVTSDHGEGFLEHGRFSHGADQYQEVLRVPLILRGGSVPASVRIDAPTSIVDVAPTIFAAAGVAPRGTLPGVDLGRDWEAPALARDERVLYSQSAPGPDKDVIRMARRGRLKLITNLESGRRELYDLKADPTEHEDLSEARPKLADELSALMDQFFVHGDEDQPNTLELDPETVERLRKLGYIE
jgi:arylsulfatase A-like enzyme